MEYKIFKFIRYNVRIPFFIRVFFWVILILISIIPIVLPIFPGSIFLWIPIFLVGFLLIVPWHKVRHVVKIRKWIIYLAQNFHRRTIIEHKMRDIRCHVRDILRTRKS